MSDVKMMFVHRDEVLALLKKAFDEGWGGFQDLRDSATEGMLEEFLEQKKIRNNDARSIPLNVRFEPMSTGMGSDHPYPEPSFSPEMGSENPYLAPSFTPDVGQRTFDWDSVNAGPSPTAVPAGWGSDLRPLGTVGTFTEHPTSVYTQTSMAASDHPATQGPIWNVPAEQPIFTR